MFLMSIVTVTEHRQTSGVLSCTMKFLSSSWHPSLICSQTSHGRLTCNTWRAWLTRGHPVWSLPIHPTHVAPSSPRNTYRRSSKVSCSSAPLWVETRKRSELPSQLKSEANIWMITQHLPHLIMLVFLSGLQTLCPHSGWWNLQWYGEYNYTPTQVTQHRWAWPSVTPARHIFHHNDSRGLVVFDGICPGSGWWVDNPTSAQGGLWGLVRWMRPGSSNQ